MLYFKNLFPMQMFHGIKDITNEDFLMLQLLAVLQQ